MNINVMIFYFINNQLSNPYFDIITPHISNIGGLPFYAVVLLIAFIITRKGCFNTSKYYGLAKLACASLILTVIIAGTLKLMFNQPRPYLVLEHVRLLTTSVDPNSFPSGHTATTASTMTILFLNAKKYFTRANLIKCFAVIYVFLIGFTRIYIGMHYPFDVLIGGIVGMVCGVVVTRFLKV